MDVQTSQLTQLLAPEEVEIRDVVTHLGKTRVFWLRQNLKNVKFPLVLIHGYGAGSGCFFRNAKGIASDRAVLMIDIPGFGESDRPQFSNEPEDDWVQALTEVFDAEIDGKFWLVGHSFGSYLSARMCLEENTRVCGLILLDAWGFPKMEETFEEKLASLKLWQRCLYRSYKKLNLTGLEPLRVVPKSIGPAFLKCIRKDLKATYGEEFLNYLYHINSREPATGERAFTDLGADFGYAKYPMEPRILKNAHRLPSEVHFVYGGESWVNSETGVRIKNGLDVSREGQYNAENDNINCTVSVVEGATHHLMCSHSTEVNDIVNRIISCK